MLKCYNPNVENKESKKLYVPAQHNPLLEKALEEINNNQEIQTLWKVINVNAIDRNKMSDHGPIHFQIVANSALRISRILTKNNIKLSIEEDFGLSQDHGELVIFLASVLHDLGMSIHRSGHEEFSIILVNDILREMLDFLPTKEKTIVISETLHSIIGHRKNGKPLTIEAGIVRVADALDMAEGRARIPFEQGHVSIYELSAESVKSVDINEGKEKLIEIDIKMHNSSGLFQVDQLLKEKLKGSGLEKYIVVKARIETETEKKMLEEIIIEDL